MFSRDRIIWQDSILSIAFDRPSMILSIDRHSSTGAPTPPNSPYNVCLHNVWLISLDMLQRRSPRLSSSALSYIAETHNKVEAVMHAATAHLQDVRNCKSLREQLEHWNLHMHASHVTSELCRPLLSRAPKDGAEVSDLLATCLSSLRQAIIAFVNLQRITTYAKYSWGAAQRAVSSALLLCIIPQTRKTPQTHELVRELITTLSQNYSDLEPSEIPTPISRALTTLGKLVYNEQASAQQTRSGGDDFQPRFDAQTDDVAADWINGFSVSPSGLPSLSDCEGSPYTAVNLIMWGKDGVLWS